MYVTPLSPVLEESLKRADTGSISLLHTADTTSLKEIINEKVIDALLHEESVLIVTEDKQDISLPAKLLSSIKLGHLCLLWNEASALSDKQLERFQILKGLNQIDIPTNEYDHLLIRKNNVKKQIISILAHLHEPLIGEHSIKSVLQNWNTGENQFPMSCKPEKEQDHLDHSMDALTQLSALYQDRFDVWDATGFLDYGIFSDKKHISKTLIDLASHEKEISNLLHGLNEVLRDIQSNMDNHIWDECDLWKSLASKMEDLYFKMEDKRCFVTWEEAAEALIKSFRSTSFLKLDDLGITYFDWDQTPYNLQKIRQYLASHREISRQHFNAFYKRLTPFNTEEERLQEMVDKGRKLIAAIGSMDYVILEMDEEILLIDRYIALLKKIAGQIHTAQHMLRDRAYLEYKQLQSLSEISQDIIDYCKNSVDESWATSYLRITLIELMKQHYDPDLRSLPCLLETNEKLADTARKTVLKVIHNRWHKKKEEVLDTSSKQNADLYRILFEAQKTTLSTNDIYFNDPTFLQGFYPVMCIQMKHLPRVLSNVHAHWDHLILLDSAATIPSNLPYQKSNVLIATHHNLDVERIMNEYPVRYFYSAERKLDYPKPFRLLNRTAKYHQALSLSSCLMSIAEKFSVFQLRNKSCISFLNHDLHEQFIELLPEDQLNILYENVNDTESMVEAMIGPESDVHILIENYMFNDRLGQHAEWQIEIKDWLISAGVKIHNICTDDFRKQPKGLLKGFVEALLSEESTEQQILHLSESIV